MLTEEQFEYLRDYLDLRKSEIKKLKSFLEKFPEEIPLEKLNLDKILEIWEFTEHYHPIELIICENYIEQKVKNILEEKVSEYCCIIWNKYNNEIEFRDFEVNPGYNYKSVVNDLEEVLNNFNVKFFCD